MVQLCFGGLALSVTAYGGATSALRHGYATPMGEGSPSPPLRATSPIGGGKLPSALPQGSA
jgi:hypothetical protein